MRKRLLVIVSLIVVASLALLCVAMSVIALFSLSIPSSEHLAKEYVERIVRGDFEATKRLGGYHPSCQEQLLNQAHKDFDYLGGAKITHLSVTVEPSGGSSDTIEFATISVDFHRPNESILHHGEILLATDHAVFGLRYVCSQVGLYSEYR